MEQTLGQLLRKLRKERGWNQQEVAARVGIDRAHVSQLENSRVGTPHRATLEKLSEVMGEDFTRFAPETAVAPPVLRVAQSPVTDAERIKYLEEQLAQARETIKQQNEREVFYQELLRKKPEGNRVPARRPVMKVA